MINKQELIETLEEQVNCYRGCLPKKDYTKGRHAVLKDVLTIAKLLDEPQKPKTEVFNHDEKFVVEWLDHTTEYHYSLYNAINDAGSEVRSWMKIGFNSHRFARALMSLDYEVEKEPLYRVKIGEGYFVEYQGRGALIMPDCNKEIKIFDSKSDAERTAQTIGGTVEEVVEG